MKLSKRWVIPLATGLVAIVTPLAWLLAWAWWNFGWLQIAPMTATKVEGTWVVGFQRDIEGEVGSIVGIEPITGSHREILDRVPDSFRVSPDGQKIAYIGSDLKLWIRPVNGGEAVQISGINGDAAWAHDGSAIITTSLTDAMTGRDVQPGTWRVDVLGSKRAKLPLPDSDTVADWSSDGRWLLTISDRHGPAGSLARDVYRVSPDGSGELRLTPDGGMNLDARFSPDGSKVVYTTTDGRKADIWVVRIDGTGATKLVGGLAADAQAVWSPDERMLLVKSDTELFLIDANGKNRRPVGLQWSGKRSLFALPDWLGGADFDPRWISNIEWLAR